MDDSQLHELIATFVTFVVFPGCIGIAIHRWRRGYRLHYLVPDWFVLAFALLTATQFAAKANAGERLSVPDLIVAGVIVLMLLGMTLERTTAARSAVHFWLRGVPWREALEIGREIRTKVDAAMDARKMRE